MAAPKRTKVERERALRSFAELGYQQGALVALQGPSGTGRGWETARCNIYANRVVTAVFSVHQRGDESDHDYVLRIQATITQPMEEV